MIDFQNASYIKLSPVSLDSIAGRVVPLLVEGEQLLAAFKGIRDFIVFTNRRIIAVNVQGLTGKKVDYTSLPFSKVVAFSVESAGTFDLDSELDLWFSGLGKVRFEFRGSVDVADLARLVGQFVL